MAFARLIFKVLLILLVLLVMIGFLLPSSAKVERSIVINASPAAVFPHLNGMRAFHAWSPWSAIDPETQYQFDGPESGIGSRMTWHSGDARVGQGSQEITESKPYTRVKTQLVFGDQGDGNATFLLEPEGNSTRVRWQFDTEFGWDLLGRYVGLMLDGMVGTSYDKGLKDLKQRIEQTPPVSAPVSAKEKG